MHWIQIICTISPSLAEAAEESFMAAGASAVTLSDDQDQPIYEPELGTTPLWQQTRITALFSADDDMQEVEQISQAVFKEMTQQSLPEYRTEILENEDWTRKWIENFKPIQFGEKLWVCPSWCEVPDNEAVNIMLDPGLAFGTGTHPTTALCLRWLDQFDLKNKTVIDFGCGSGILGIAAWLLGAQHVIAIDNDPQALIATRENAERNGVPADAIITCLPEDTPETKAEVVVANILAQPLYSLRDTLAGLLLDKGHIALSGILAHQADELRDHYTACFKMDAKQEDSGWIRLSGKLS